MLLGRREGKIVQIVTAKFFGRPNLGTPPMTPTNPSQVVVVWRFGGSLLAGQSEGTLLSISHLYRESSSPADTGRTAHEPIYEIVWGDAHVNLTGGCWRNSA